MASAMKVFRKFQSSDGRIKIVTLSGVSVLVAIIALLVGVLPAIAGEGEPSGLGVQPTEISYGGGSGACDAEEFDGLPSDGGTELWINNPMTGEYTGPDGTKVKITVKTADTLFDFEFVNNPNKAAYDVIVNGGAKNTHYDYDQTLFGPVRADTVLHAPTKGNGSNLFSLSHINICYGDFVPSVEGAKYHDRDVDGTLDATEEEGLSDWTIAAFDNNGNLVRKAKTDSNGSYVLGNLGPGVYTICEAKNTSGLPDSTTNANWVWTQSQPGPNDLCSEFAGYEPDGYSVSGTDDNPVSGLDFGNHTQVSVTCDPNNDVVVSLEGAADEPSASVTFPAGCESGLNGNDPFITSFDLGLSDNDGDDWDQFVVFGGESTSTQVLTQVIEWAPELAVYNSENELVVPTTRVLFPGETALEDVLLCSDVPDGPTSDVPQCLDSRLIAEGGDLPLDHIQLTETYKLLGDPPNFR